MIELETLSRVQHATFTVERVFPQCTPDALFAAYADLAARVRWAVPPGQEIRYDAADFRCGGRDLFRCGSPGALDCYGDLRYEDIEPGQRIVYVETLADDDRRLSSALCSMLFTEEEGGVRLSITVQLAAYDGAPMREGYLRGWRAVLERLQAFLEASR
jgi:uncharacterized protein YndB with AHSA1/START domain